MIITLYHVKVITFVKFLTILFVKKGDCVIKFLNEKVHSP